MIDAFIYKAVFRSHSLFGGVLEVVLTVHNPSKAIENRVVASDGPQVMSRLCESWRK
jgi:hypothetical protein